MENVMHRERCDREAASGHPVTSEAQQAELPVSFELLQHGVIGHLCGSTIELSRAAGETECPSKPTREFEDGHAHGCNARAHSRRGNKVSYANRAYHQRRVQCDGWVSWVSWRLVELIMCITQVQRVAKLRRAAGQPGAQPPPDGK